MDDGLDWISIVTTLAQRDDGVFTWPKGGYDRLSISGRQLLRNWPYALNNINLIIECHTFHKTSLVVSHMSYPNPK